MFLKRSPQSARTVYREPMLPEEALQLIQADAGKRFDVKVVAAFLALHHGDPLALSEIGDTRASNLHDRYGSGALLLSRLQAIKP